MQIAILGHGKEGQSAEKYFLAKNHQVEVFDNFTTDTLSSIDFSHFDLILRSPSVPPLGFDVHADDNTGYNWSSMTKYFFEHCPCPIIGVTGTKGKGTTCSMILSIFQELHKKTWLVGNIGTPAIDILDDLKPDHVVIYEMSSFQLWDLEKSPHVAVILKIEPDHLNIHKDFAEYTAAKGNIAKYQTTKDYCVYYRDNPESRRLATLSRGIKVAYPIKTDRKILDRVLNMLTIPGQHNRENAEAALTAVASFYDETIFDFIDAHENELALAMKKFQGLPHRLQFLRELNHVRYYDDNFATNVASTQVALESFRDEPIILIAGGRDKTDNADLPEIARLIKKHVTKAVLIGESGRELCKLLPEKKWVYANNLQEATFVARVEAEKIAKKQPAILLMSPAAASFDMFENVYDRGTKFQKIVQELE